MKKIRRMVALYSHYNVLLLLLLPSLQQDSCAQADDQQQAVQYNPLSGSKTRFPGPIAVFQDSADLTRLLDVGACLNTSDPYVSYVPPLDGTSSYDTLCQQDYAMKFVLFDLQLVELKEVDPVGGSFRAEIQMIFHWLDYLNQESDISEEADDNCNFLCDDNRPQSRLCCDNVWVPPLNLLGCDLHETQSSTPMPSIYTMLGNTSLTIYQCVHPTYKGKCFWRRLWYLNIDATCTSHMDFHDFPFDVQSLTINILNPYASRTWFQLTKGFLEQNVGEGVNNVKLSPDSNIPGWQVKNITISGTCGITQAWQETFLTQDSLLQELEDDSNKRYNSQEKEIREALSMQNLQCVAVEDFRHDNNDLASSLDMDLYSNIRDNLYKERLDSTLEEYNTCMQLHNGTDFSWNMAINTENFTKIRNNLASEFSTSKENIERSFNLLNLTKVQATSQIWFPCAIKAIANLTTPGIQVTILVQRYRKFYVVKLILPIVACVAFSFTAFGLQPKELLGRLTVVVPSAIALTALQGLVVATDMPPVAYIAPSTYIMLFSYLAQLLVAFESIVVYCMCARKRVQCLETRVRSASSLSRKDAPSIRDASTRSFQILREQEGLELVASTSTSGPVEVADETDRVSNLDREKDAPVCTRYPASNLNANGHAQARQYPTTSHMEEDSSRRPQGLSATRIVDFLFLGVFAILYIVAIFVCIYLPYLRSERLMSEIEDTSISIWPNSSP